MVAPGLYPQQAPRPTDSHAESAVWHALRTQLPAGWYAWHSLRVRTKKGWTREGDFVLAVPSRGLLVLEVKGGEVEQRDGRWLQNGRPMGPPPLEQAHGALRCLLDRLNELDCQPPAYGVALCFPDVAFSNPPQRCHPAIQALADRYVAKPVDASVIAVGVREGVIGVVTCTAETQSKRIGDEISRLLADGLAPNDIAVLSLRGRGAEGGIVHRERLGAHRVVAADDPAMAEHVVCDTFLRFKGLERPAIIVTDLVEPGHRQRGVRMHVAFTRALDVVRIAGTREALASDPLLPPAGGES